MYSTPPPLPPTGLRRWWRDLWRPATPKRIDWINFVALLVFSVAVTTSYPVLALDRIGAWGVFLAFGGFVTRSAAEVLPPGWAVLTGSLRLLTIIVWVAGVSLCLLEAIT